MKMIVGLAGVCLVGFAAGTYFQGFVTGLCVMLALLGAGLILDAMKK